MYHICYSNPNAWAISYKTGVYGNVNIQREGKEENAYVRGLWGLFTDLTALKAGDRIFFYVKESQVLKGVFEVKDNPYFCQDTLFKDNLQTYPFRFNFSEVKHYENPIPVSILAGLIENGQLNSITSFERDVQGSFRGIRQITNDEGYFLENLFSRLNPKSNPNLLVNYSHNEISDEVELTKIIDSIKTGDTFQHPVRINFSILPLTKKSKTKFICEYESALKGFIFYCLRRQINNVVEDIGLTNFSECLMEFPMMKAQQHSADILCVFRNEMQYPHYYSFIELKRDKKISITDLSQLISYMKTFSITKRIPFSEIEGIYVSNSFHQDTINYLSDRRKVEKENPVRLIEYSINERGLLKFNQIEI